MFLDVRKRPNFTEMLKYLLTMCLCKCCCTFVLLDPVPRLQLPQVRAGVSQRKWQTLTETCQLLKLAGRKPLVVSHLWQTWESVKDGLWKKKGTALERLISRRLYLYTDTNLHTEVPGRIKGTKEEVLLDPDPVLVGISGEENILFLKSGKDKF